MTNITELLAAATTKYGNNHLTFEDGRIVCGDYVICEYDAESNTLAFCNAAAARQIPNLDIPVMSAVGQSVRDALSRDPKNTVQTSMMTTLRKKPAPMPSTYTPYGEPFVPLKPVAQDYYVPASDRVMFDFIEASRLKGEREVILLTGPTGTGKTSQVEHYAYRYQLPLFIMDMGTVREAMDLIGFKELHNDGAGMKMRFVESDLVKALTTPNAVILFDEANRLPAAALNSLFPLLDHRGRVHVPGSERPITVAENVIFFLTMNLGSAYAGTHTADAAFLSRTTRSLEVGYLPEAEEIALIQRRYPSVAKENVKKLVRIANDSRVAAASGSLRMGLSTRDTLKTAQIMEVGASLGMACEKTFVVSFSASGGDKSDRAAIRTILQKHGVDNK